MEYRFYLSGEYLKKRPDCPIGEDDPADWPWRPFETSDLHPDPDSLVDNEFFIVDAPDKEIAIEQAKVLVNRWRRGWWGFIAELWHYPDYPSSANMQMVYSWELC